MCWVEKFQPADNGFALPLEGVKLSSDILLIQGKSITRKRIVKVKRGCYLALGVGSLRNEHS
jgi:hypothetical protein